MVDESLRRVIPLSTLRRQVAKACVLQDMDEVLLAGIPEDGPNGQVIWLQLALGAIDRVEDGFLAVEGPAPNLMNGRAGTFAGIWVQGRIRDPQPVASENRVPVVLHADPILPPPSSLTEAAFEEFLAAKDQATNGVSLASGGTANRSVSFVLRVTNTLADWWPDFSDVRLDLGVCVVPTHLWERLDGEAINLVGRPSLNTDSPLDLVYGVSRRSIRMD